MSSVSPTSSSPSSTDPLSDLSFSTGGGGGTSILDGVMTAGPVAAAEDSEVGGWPSTTGDDAGDGNLKSLFIVPALLFRLPASGDDDCRSSTSSGVASKPDDDPWLTMLSLRAGGGIDARWFVGVLCLFGGGLLGVRLNEACDIDCGRVNPAECAGAPVLAPR